jgi:hypothetical protein
MEYVQELKLSITVDPKMQKPLQKFPAKKPIYCNQKFKEFCLSYPLRLGEK